MAAVTQLHSNYLGGVSKQIDNKKLTGQVDEVLNGIADATFGMEKRRGTKFLSTLKKEDGSIWDPAELEGAHWFFIAKQLNDSFFGCINNGSIYVWNAITGAPCSVTINDPDYLNGDNFHVRTIQDTSIITNKDVVVTEQATPSYIENAVATVVITRVEYSTRYTVTINGQDCEYVTRDEDQVTSTEKLDAEEILNELAIDIRNKFPGWSVNVWKTSLEIVSSPLDTFTIEAGGGVSGNDLYTFQDTIQNTGLLPPESNEDRRVKVENSTNDKDDYYLTFDAAAGAGGPGTWKETEGFGTSLGLVNETMPHELRVKDGTVDEFEFGPAEYNLREAGNESSNAAPSFVGNTISCSFFYNNRFGVLSEDNIILSRANEPKNFYITSAFTPIASDPVDINVSATMPTKLFGVLACPQGLQVFGTKQQFLLTSDGSAITPANALVRQQSGYEMAQDVEPKDLGVRDVFLNRMPGYSKLFSMQQRGVEETPAVIDLSKVVTGWLPYDITKLTASPQNSLALLSSPTNEHVYVFRYFNNGEQDLFQSWTKWELTGNLLLAEIAFDMVFMIIEHQGELVYSMMSLNDLDRGETYDAGTASTPNLDLYCKPTLTYDSGSNTTIFNTGYAPVAGKTPIMLIGTEASGITPPTSLLEVVGNFTGTRNPDSTLGYWTELDTSNGDFRLRGDWTEYTDSIIVGYQYEFEVELPTFYFNQGQLNAPIYDYTANLTVNRCKFSVGKTGAVTFKLKSRGSDEWVDIEHTTMANYYDANSAPVLPENVFTVPIHQRNMNFKLKLNSNQPFPVSLVSMMWEGQYSPRFYRRS